MKIDERKKIFLEKMKSLYGDKYSLDKIYDEYSNIDSQVSIMCPIHGEVKMKARVLLRGKGCKFCSIEKNGKKRSLLLKGKHQDQKEWIEYCSKKHGGKYDYSLVDFDNKREDGKVPIICHEIGEDGHEHGVFWQLPNQHKWGKGCKKCTYLTSEKIIERAKKVHGDDYDYSLVKYNGAGKHIDIICKKCGKIFSITPHNLMKGRGCPYCAIDKRIKKLHLPIETVKERITKIFGEKYDLSQITYINENFPITLTCPIHGEFKQTPFMLFKGCGCQKCGQSHLENEIQTFLENNKIKSVYEKTFEWLGRQSLDFYLPEYNVAIECQGKQHFSPQAFGGVTKEEAKTKYIETIKLDERKKELCEKNGIKLFYYSDLGIKYPYEVFEDKEKMLNEIKLKK